MRRVVFPSVDIGESVVAVGDPVRVKAGFLHPWHKGVVEQVQLRLIKVRTTGGRLITVCLGGKDRRGKVEPLPAEEGREELRRLRRGDPDYLKVGTLPQIRAVTGTPGRAVPRPAPPARSPRFLAYVRLQPCACCGKPAPSDAHHAGEPPHKAVGRKVSDHLCVPLCRLCHEWITCTGALPRMSKAEASAVVVPVWSKEAA